MPTRSSRVQYTVRGVPREVDVVLRRKARQRGISLNHLLVEKLSEAQPGPPKKYRDMSDLGGFWKEDPEFDRILEEQRVIDPEIWK